MIGRLARSVRSSLRRVGGRLAGGSGSVTRGMTVGEGWSTLAQSTPSRRLYPRPVERALMIRRIISGHEDSPDPRRRCGEHHLTQSDGDIMCVAVRLTVLSGVIAVGRPGGIRACEPPFGLRYGSAQLLDPLPDDIAAPLQPFIDQSADHLRSRGRVLVLRDQIVKRVDARSAHADQNACRVSLCWRHWHSSKTVRATVHVPDRGDDLVDQEERLTHAP